MKTVLITGATGFVGSSLLHFLNNDPSYRVVASVRDSSIKVPLGVFSVVCGDVAQETGWTKALEDVDVVVHLAARAHVLKEKSESPISEFRRVNVQGTLQLAKAAIEAGVKRFIFISSIGVNGNASNRPFTAFDDPKPAEPYALSKHEAEAGLRALVKNTSMDLVVIRPPLVYGPNAPGNFGMLMSAIQRRWILPLGAIKNKRSLVALDNLIDLIVTCIDHPAAANQTFLVSDGEDLSTTELLRRVGAAVDKPARLLPVPPKLLEFGASLLGKKAVAQRLLGSLQVDISHTCSTLGWKPPVTVDEALAKTAAFYLEEHGAS